jgi:citrate synthase
MAAVPAASKGGLEGIVAGRSTLCDIDGQTGRLHYAGYDIADLAEHSSFVRRCRMQQCIRWLTHRAFATAQPTRMSETLLSRSRGGLRWCDLPRLAP